MKQGVRISALQLAYLMIFQMVATALFLMQHFTAKQSPRDSWLVAIIFLIFLPMMMYIWFTLGRRFPDMSIIQFSPLLVGKAMGHVIGLIYLIWFISLCGIVLREFTEVMSIFFQSTPPVVMAVVMMSLSSYAVKCGIEVIGRMTEFLFPIIFTITFISFLPGIVMADFDNLLPAFEKGIKPAILQGIYPVVWGGEMVSVLMLFPYLKNSGDAKLGLMVAFLFTFFSGLVAETLSTAVLGVSRSEYLYPLMELTKVTFLRLDFLIFTFWVSGLLVKISFIHFCSSLTLSQVLSLKDYRPVVMPLAVLISVVSFFVLGGILEMYDFIGSIFPPYAIFHEFIIPLFLLMIAVISKKRGPLKPPDG